MVVHGIVDAGQAICSDMEEGAGGVVAVDEIDEGFAGAEDTEIAGAGGFDEAGAAGSVNAAEADDSSAGIEGELFGGEKNVGCGRAAYGGGFIDDGAVVLRINGGAAGENGKCRREDFEQVAQGVVINNAVSVGLSSFFAAQAMDEDIGVLTAGEAAAQFCWVGRVCRDDAVRFFREAFRGFFRGDEGGDVGSGVAKKIRASFTGVTATGEEDARS